MATFITGVIFVIKNITITRSDDSAFYALAYNYM